MKKLGVYEQAQARLVLGENIAQTAQFIETGAADIGIIALSLAIAPAMRDKGRYWEVPLEAYPRMDQGGVILSWAKDLESATRFRAFVTEPVGEQCSSATASFYPENKRGLDGNITDITSLQAAPRQFCLSSACRLPIGLPPQPGEGNF